MIGIIDHGIRDILRMDDEDESHFYLINVRQFPE